MSNDPRSYEPHVNTADFLDAKGEYEPDPSKSVSLPADRQKIVDTVIKMYNGKMADSVEDMRATYHPSSVYDDIMSFADTRKKIAAQFLALPKCFSNVEVKEYQVAKNQEDLVVLKLRTAYTAPVYGITEVKHLVTLALSSTEGTPLVRYHKDQWNEKDYTHTGLGALFKKMNGEVLPIIMSLPSDL